MRNKRKIQLSDHFDYQTLLRFTTPSVLMMVISSVYSIVDGLFISNFAGADGFAAVNLMMPIAMLISCLAFMAGAGGSALVSKTLGEHQEEKARRIFSLIVYLILVIAVIIGSVAFCLIPEIASVMGAEGAIYDNCVVYGRILIAALPAYMLQVIFQSLLVVAEQPKMGMVIAISSGVTNVVLDALFVAVLPWGVAGAAAATVIGQMIGGIVPLLYFIRKKNRLLWFVKADMDWFALKRVAANGLSSFINEASLSVISIVFNLRLMALVGSDGVIAYGVVMYVSYIISGVFNGYSTGIAPVFSYNLGAGNTEENKGLFKRSIFVIAAFAVIFSTLILIFARVLAAIFVSYDAELMNMTTEAIRLYDISLYLAGFNIFAAAFFAALNNGFVSSILSVTRTFIFQLICVYALPAIIGSIGIWLSVAAAEILSLAVTLTMLLKNRRKYGYW